MPKRSAGLLVYRVTTSGVAEVLLAHPGGPFWAKRDAGAWSVPKGEYEDGDDALATAFREFREEIGQAPPNTEAVPLGELAQPGGKRVLAWAIEGDLDVTHTASNTFEMEWPPKSGRRQRFPEIDRVAYFALPVAKTKIIAYQSPLLDELEARLR